jgi:hypothetical protein
MARNAVPGTAVDGLRGLIYTADESGNRRTLTEPGS